MLTSNPQLEGIIRTLLMLGAEITITEKNGKILFNLNTQAKSDVILSEEDGKIRADMRYGKFDYVESIVDVTSLVKQGMYGRDYVSVFWAGLIEKYL